MTAREPGCGRAEPAGLRLRDPETPGLPTPSPTVGGRTFYGEDLHPTAVGEGGACVRGTPARQPGGGKPKDRVVRGGQELSEGGPPSVPGAPSTEDHKALSSRDPGSLGRGERPTKGLAESDRTRAISLPDPGNPLPGPRPRLAQGAWPAEVRRTSSRGGGVCRRLKERANKPGFPSPGATPGSGRPRRHAPRGSTRVRCSPLP